MKRVKKMFALLLVAVMAFAMATTAFATGNDGKITVTNATVGKSYAIYKVFDATYKDNTSGAQNVSYTYTRTGTEDTLYAALVSDASPFTLTSTQVPNVYVVSLKDEKSASDISTFLTNNIGRLTQTGSAVTATSATVVFSGLAYGYYYITSSLGSTVTIDSALKEVKVIDKNQAGPGDFDKDIKNSDQTDKVSTANYGDTVKYEISVNTTNYLYENKILEYYINDAIGTGLSYQKDTLAVKVGDDSLTVNDDYEVVYAADNQSFKITIKWYDAQDEFLYVSPSKITVTYSATVDTDAVIAGEGNKNIASFGYKTDETTNPTHNSESVTTTTYVYALAIEKVDPDGNPLQDAHFNIGNLKASKGEDGVYSYTGTAASAADATDFVSDENGMIVIKGVKAGTYTVTETKSPAGYNLMKDTVSITTSLVGQSTATGTTVYYYDEEGGLVDTEEEGYESSVSYSVTAHMLEVVNTTGTELPSTGGMGTTIFYTVGALLVVAAGILLVTKKRMNMDG